MPDLPNDLSVPTTTRVLGQPVHQVDMPQTLAQIVRWVEAAHTRQVAARCHQIVTLNPEIVMAAQRHEGLSAAIREADLVLADGIGVAWAAGLRLRGQPQPRVTGVDLLEQTARLAADQGYRLFLLGAAPGVAAAAGAAMVNRYPALQLVGEASGNPAAEDATALLERLNAARPDILFVAFGSPAQECWIAQQRISLQAAGLAVAVGVGGAFDFLAGCVPRAPRWMRRVGLEWLYRLVREPWRWRRMLVLPRFAIAALRERRERVP